MIWPSNATLLRKVGHNASYAVYVAFRVVMSAFVVVESRASVAEGPFPVFTLPA